MMYCLLFTTFLWWTWELSSPDHCWILTTLFQNLQDLSSDWGMRLQEE